jgi:hypothetical protein
MGDMSGTRRAAKDEAGAGCERTPGQDQHPWLAACAIAGIAGQVAFTLAAWLLPAPSGLGLAADTISALANERYGAIQTATFVLSGVGTLALAAGIRATTRGAWGSLAGSSFVGLLGIGSLVVAIFPTERAGQGPTTVGTIHIAAAVVAFIAIVCGMYTLARTFQHDARWRSCWRWTLALALIATIGLVVQAQRNWPGLTERLFLATTTTWQIVAAHHLYRIAQRAKPKRTPDR